jgi:hypothetical protein
VSYVLIATLWLAADLAALRTADKGSVAWNAEHDVLQ